MEKNLRISKVQDSDKYSSISLYWNFELWKRLTFCFVELFNFNIFNNHSCNNQTKQNAVILYATTDASAVILWIF